MNLYASRVAMGRGHCEQHIQSVAVILRREKL